MAKKSSKTKTEAATPQDINKTLERVCALLEGPPEPLDQDEEPASTIRFRAWQAKGSLWLTSDGLVGDHWVEVVFEGSQDAVEEKHWVSTGLTFDLPPLWLDHPGPRFLTVYARQKKSLHDGSEKEVQEEATTIIRIVPATLGKVSVDDFDDANAIGDVED